MRALTPWRPARALTALRTEFDDLFSRFFGTEGGESRDSFWGDLFAPAVDTEVRDGKFIVTADLPGMDPKSVDVSVSGDRLTIHGERKADTTDKTAYHRRERPWGKFSRAIHLPADLDVGKAEAHFHQGVMTLRIPRAQAAKPRQITVKAA